MLSSEPKKTTMKYLKEGPRVFMPFQSNEIIIENIKEACKTFFHKHHPCDILASEMGPSCTRVNQVHISKYCIFNLLVLKSLQMICHQSQVDMSVNILNPITSQVHQKYQSIATLKALHIQQFHIRQWEQIHKFLKVCQFHSC